MTLKPLMLIPTLGLVCLLSACAGPVPKADPSQAWIGLQGESSDDLLALERAAKAGQIDRNGALTARVTLKLGDGFSYKFTTNDANVASGTTLAMNASALTGTNALTFDATAETNGFFAITGGAGADSVTYGSHFSASDTFNGGAGNDTLILNPSFSTINTTFTATTITNVETLKFANIGVTINITTNDANVASGATLTVDASAITTTGGAFIFDGSAETDGHFAFIGSGDSQGTVLTGGALSDTFTLGVDFTASNTINGEGVAV